MADGVHDCGTSAGAEIAAHAGQLRVHFNGAAYSAIADGPHVGCVPLDHGAGVGFGVFDPWTPKFRGARLGGFLVVGLRGLLLPRGNASMGAALALSSGASLRSDDGCLDHHAGTSL